MRPKRHIGVNKRFPLKYDNQTVATLIVERDKTITLEHNLTFEELRMLPLVTPVDEADRTLMVRNAVSHVMLCDNRHVRLPLVHDKFRLLDVRDPKGLAGLRVESAPWQGAGGDEFVLKLGPFHMIRIYHHRVLKLYDEVDEWLRNTPLRTSRRSHEVTENIYGSYEISLLEIRDPNGNLIATLEPMGLSVIGAEGRVEIIGRVDRQGIVYFPAGGPQIIFRVGVGPSATPVSRPVFKGVTTEGWYWLESARLSRARPLDEALFKDLLRGVTDYYELSAP